MKRSFKIFCTIIVIAALVAICNSLMARPGVYATFNWVLDYRFGFCKRGFLGTVFHLFLDVLGLDWNFENLNKAICNSHIVVSLLVLISIIALYVKSSLRFQKYGYLFFYLFVTLICSFFIKDLFYLTGYLDVWISLFFVFILFALLKGFRNLAVILGVVASLFTELSFVFWFPILISYTIIKGVNWQTLALSLPLISSVIVHLSGVPIKYVATFYSSFGDFSKFYAIDFDEFLYNVYYLFANQYHLFDYIQTRVAFLLEKPFKILVSFLLLGGASLFISIIALRQIYTLKQSAFKRFLAVAAALVSMFSPLLLLLVATDFFRFAGFTVFSSFIFVYSFYVFAEDNTLSDSILYTGLISKIGLSLGYVVSLLTLFMPPLTTQGTNYILFTEEAVANLEYSQPFVLKPVLLFKDSLYSFFAHFTHDDNQSFKHQVIFSENKSFVCSMKGASFIGETQSYGKTRVTIRTHFADSDPDSFKFIRIMNKRFRIDRNVEESFDFYISDVESMKFPSLIVLVEPSSADWLIDKFEVTNISTE